MPVTGWQAACRSDTGRIRMQNQDAVFAGAVAGAPGWLLLAVADGVGGHARGEWASHRAVEVLARTLGGHLAAGGLQEALPAAFAEANDTVITEARQMGAPGAATTLVAALLRDDLLYWANTGDSRIYLLAGTELQQLSSDHSWVAERVRAGQLTAAEAWKHPRRNLITRSIGFEPASAPDTGGPVVVPRGATVLLCSDGLHGEVSDAVIAAAAAAGTDVDAAATALVGLANEAGGRDNISVALARRSGGGAPPAAGY